MPDDLDSHAIARRTFEVTRRGYEQQEVRAYLHEVSSLLDRLQREASGLRERAERAEARLGLSEEPDEAMLMQVLGEETTRVLTSAREAATDIRTKAEAAAERIVADATSEASETRADAVREADRRMADAKAHSEELRESARTELERRTAEAEEAASRIRADAAADAQSARDEGQRDLERVRAEAEAELEAARAKGRDMVAEAQAVRERVLRDLAARRKKARQQVEKLNAGRERLLEAYALVRRTVDEATTELHTSLSDARLAADAAARRIDDEPEPTSEELDAEIAAAGLVEHPITVVPESSDESEEDDGPGPFSGEVPAVGSGPAHEPSGAPPEPEASPDPDARRSRRARRRRGGFEGLPQGELTRVEPPAEGEGVRLLAEPAAESGPEPSSAPAEGDDAELQDPEPTGPEDAPLEEPVAEDAAAGEDEVASPEPSPDEPSDDGAEPEVAVDATTDEAGIDDEPTVDDLFARLRAAQGSEPHAEASPAEEAPSTTDDGATEEPADTPFTERDAALADVDKELARRVKRALADEQNEVLDLLRRAKPAGVDDLLPSADDHAARWAEVVAEPLADAARTGAAVSGGKARSVSGLADELARGFTAPLRERIDRSFAASDGNLDDVSDRVRALYREWKGQRLTDSCRHHTAAAYAQGLFGALPKGTAVHWVLDPSGGPCPDCDDNVLGGTVTKGEEFPTGHQCAPAHPGCRCLVLQVPA